ncbi:MAG: hypothetical protein ACLUSM_01785 [Enterococcus avium]
MKAESVSLEAFIQIMSTIQRDEKVGLSAYPEHFQVIMNEQSITGIEPFGIYGTPTLVHVAIIQENQLSPVILESNANDWFGSLNG